MIVCFRTCDTPAFFAFATALACHAHRVSLLWQIARILAIAPHCNMDEFQLALLQGDHYAVIEAEPVVVPTSWTSKR